MSEAPESTPTRTVYEVSGGKVFPTMYGYAEQVEWTLMGTFEDLLQACPFAGYLLLDATKRWQRVQIVPRTETLAR